MDRVDDILQRVSVLTREPIRYPDHLLRNYDLSNDFDRENLGYLTKHKEEAYYHWLTYLAREAIGAKLIVELGNRHGNSTIALFYGLQPETCLVSVDVVKDQRYIPDVIRHDPRVRIVIGDCLDLTTYESAGLSIPIDIDILWSDTVHFYKQIQAEFSIYEPLLADEAIVAIDDINVNDKRRFFDDAPFPKQDLTKLCHGNGFGVLHYSRPASERNRTSEERIALALRRSVKAGFGKYWELVQEHETLINQVGQSLLLTLQQRIVAAWHVLRKIRV